MKLLLVASDRMEFAGALARATDVKSAPISVDWARSARLSGNQVLLVANGIGGKRAAAAVDTAVASFHPEAVASIGFCGALDQCLDIAAIVVATGIVETAAECAACRHSPAAEGPISSIDRVAASAEEKRRLRSTGAIAVEMEAAGVAGRAQAHQLPFFCVKAVTDLAGETMANDFNAAIRSDGHFDTIKILTGTLRHPTVRIPELIRLRNRCVRAARALGEFIADCRF
jgi:adenosylhomocysteine nucleosidase